jgi:hypothetical protein
VFATSRGIQWTVYKSLRGENKNAYRYLVGNLSEGDHLEDLSVNGRIILKCVLKLIGRT